MKLENKHIAIINGIVENKMFLTVGDQKADIVQISGKWIKFRFPETDSTGVFQLNMLRPSDQKWLRIADGKAETGNTLFVQAMPIDGEILKAKWARIQSASENEEQVLAGPFQSINDEMFLPFDTMGRPVAEYETVKVGGRTEFVQKSSGDDGFGHETRTRLEAPLAFRSIIINKGRKSMNDSVVFAYRVADYDNKMTPLSNFENLFSDSVKQMNESGMTAKNRPSATERRMKLFAAAEHEGAKIRKDGNWIAAVCFEYRQCHVFGRLKPKVVPGTNDIDPACNLEDWEGITPENAAKRDDPSLPWVKDGITDGHGHVFDKLSGESGQPRVSFGCETAWCNCGVLNRDGTWEPKDKSNMYFEYYNNGGKTPYIIFMDMSRGALYQYVRVHRAYGDIVNFLNEDDKTDGGTLGNPPDRVQEDFFRDFCNVNPDFRKFVNELDAEYFG